MKEHDTKKQNDFTPSGVIRWKGFDELYTIRDNIDILQTVKEKFGLNDKDQEEQTETKTMKTTRINTVIARKNQPLVKKNRFNSGFRSLLAWKLEFF